jgi:hypothetical protein
MLKLSFPLSLCISALAYGAVACQASNSELPKGTPVAYGASGTGDQAGSEGVPVAGQVAASAGSGAAAIGGGAGTQATGAAGFAGGAGGTTSTAGSSADAGGPAAGSGGATAGAGGSGGGGATAGAGGSGGGGATCPTDYTTATHIVINVSWKSTTVLNAGSGKVHVWTKSNFSESGSTASVTSRSCGSVLPAITTSAIAGSENILPEIPDAAWDNAAMPTFTGTATRSGNNLTVDPGVALLGLTMSNPTAAWPAASAITGLDQDGDGELGITAVSKVNNGFSAPPTDISKSHRADKIYLAIRNIMTLSASAAGCPASYTGTANVSKFDNHVIGCHVQGGSECTTTQRDFVDSNRTVYTINSATFTSQKVSGDATCADVRTLLPIQ